MSATQTNITPPIQIHPLAELHETAFQLGIIRQRNLILASENLMMKERIQVLEAENKELIAVRKEGAD